MDKKQEIQRKIDQCRALPGLSENDLNALQYWTPENIKAASPEDLSKLESSLDARLSKANVHPSAENAIESDSVASATKLEPNEAFARDFIAKLAGSPDSPVTFQTFDDLPTKREEKRKELSRTLHGTFDQHKKELARLNREGAGIFMAVNEMDGTRRTLDNFKRARALIADFDKLDDNAEKAASVLPPSIRVESSPGKYHLYWLLDRTSKASSPEEIKAAQLGIAEKYGSDKSAADAVRVLRLPGFFHLKNPDEPFMVHEVGIANPTKPMLLTELKKKLNVQGAAPAPKAVTQAAQVDDAFAEMVTPKELDQLREALNVLDLSDYHDWNDACADLHELGEDGYQLWLEASKRTTRGNFDEKECRRKWEKDFKGGTKSGFRNIFKKANAVAAKKGTTTTWNSTSAEDDFGEEEPMRWPFKPLDMGRVFDEDAKATKWLFHQRVPGNRASLLTGIGGTSKTQMLYQMAIAAILGKCSWGWTVDTTGKAVLVLTEDDENDPHITLRIITQEMGLSDEQIGMVKENLTIYPLAGEDVKLMVRDPETKALVPSRKAALLEDHIKELGGVAFIGIDPALGISEGDEASQSDQRALGRYADNLAVRCDCAVTIISHGTKGSLQTDELNSHSSRGAGAITDAVRLELAMRTMTAKEAGIFGVADIAERESYVQLKATKGNRIPPEAKAPIWFRRSNGGFLIPIELEPTERGGISPRAQQAMDAIAELDPDNKGVRLQDWRQCCLDKKIVDANGQDAGKKAMSRLVKSLLDGKHIKKGDEHGIYQRNFASLDDDADEEDAA